MSGTMTEIEFMQLCVQKSNENVQDVIDRMIGAYDDYARRISIQELRLNQLRGMRSEVEEIRGQIKGQIKEMKSNLEELSRGLEVKAEEFKKTTVCEKFDDPDLLLKCIRSADKFADSLRKKRLKSQLECMSQVRKLEEMITKLSQLNQPSQPSE
jgi:hypothetical protein